jgi:hypothetical protein
MAVSAVSPSHSVTANPALAQAKSREPIQAVAPVKAEGSSSEESKESATQRAAEAPKQNDPAKPVGQSVDIFA